MWGGVGGLFFYSWNNCMSEQVARRDSQNSFLKDIKDSAGQESE